MPTFNGWNIISLPTTPSAPASVEFTPMDIVAMSVSPFTGQQQVQDWQQGWLEASVSYPPLTQAQARPWVAFLKGLRGQANVFQIGDPLATPRGSGAGTPVVAGAGQKGYTLNTRGWTPGASGVLLLDDYLQIGYRLYSVTLSDVDADGSGNATINIWPPLRESPANGDAITITNTKGLFRLKSNARKWSETTARVYGIQFECKEAL
jgi:hypothetical protein